MENVLHHPGSHSETDKGDLPEVAFFWLTGRNEYIALCELDSVSLGGG
jgi:hypothetical protein